MHSPIPWRRPGAVVFLASLLALAAACPGARTSSSGATAPAGKLDQAEPLAHPGSFADNPIVYFVMTDRFYNGNPENDRSYGRAPDGEQEIGTFHGGDLAGLTRKLEDGYFRDLGVNGIWITAPYEQIHGWVVGGNKEFRHYAYHGYYALDYTALDQNMGTEDELGAFIDAAHAQGIRVIFDIVMNHPGYADLQTLTEYGVEVVWPGWEQATLEDYHSYFDYNNFDFTAWWGPDWVRAGLPGYQAGHSYDPLTMQLAYLPDFKTEADSEVAIPKFLARKSDTRARTIPGYKVRDYLVKWLTDWVREYGVDGFRCDTAKHVELASWAALKAEASRALQEWKAANPDKAVDSAGFWMTGEVFPHGVERSEYFDHGFDSIINFDLQREARAIAQGEGIDTAALDALYSEYARTMGAAPGFNVLSYLSSHDTELFPRDRLIAGGTVLLLAPGGVQIFYGDETARPLGPMPGSDPQQATRSSMNWDAVDAGVLAHWQTLGRFRRRHVALSRGNHRKLDDSPYTFARVHGDEGVDDRVVVAIGAGGAASIAVGDVFAEGALVRDAYTGAQARVAQGRVAVRAGERGVVLLEALR
jgi:alpha-amylase